jgi:hypothetical protein
LGDSEFQDGQEIGVLGHIGFFDRFKVLFDQPNLYFDVSR